MKIYQATIESNNSLIVAVNEELVHKQLCEQVLHSLQHF